MNTWGIAFLCLAISLVAHGQGTQPLVAIHDSELTRALDSSNSPAVFPTPTGPGTTGLQWWSTNWHYFVMPESLKEALRSDGTAFTVLGDSNITAGVLLTNGAPKYPIMISYCSEAMRDDEIAPLTNFVAAGGILLVGGSSFTRNTNGTTRGDFAFPNELGLHMASPGLTNWTSNTGFTKQLDHRLVNHIPGGQLTWRMPSSSEEISWGVSPSHPFLGPHDMWRVTNVGATQLAMGDYFPILFVRPFGKGWFIYHAASQPLFGHGGFAPGMYAYLIVRRAIEWSFENLNLPVPKISPWGFPYDAALMVRHDLENFTNEVANIELSAGIEYTNGVKGDYYFCTGTLRDDAYPFFDTNSIVASLRRAVTNFGASIGPHNGGLKNPSNPALLRGQYDYWHWGPDEALDYTPTNYANGKAYAMTSISNAFLDVESWLTGITNGLRSWVACNFNATREDSYDLQAQLKTKIVGDNKISPFPNWVFSTRTAGKRYAMLTEPVSDWFVNGLVAQSLEPWHPPGVHTSQTMHDAVDFYYGLGALVNVYSHTMSTGLGDAGQLTPDYVTYCMNTNLHPRLWSANALLVYQWWLQRSNMQMSVSYSTNSTQLITTAAISGAGDFNDSIEFLMPATGTALNLQVYTNTVLAGASQYRINGQVIKVRVGTTVTNAQIRYVLGPSAQNDNYITRVNAPVNVAAPGVLANDTAGLNTNLTAVLVSATTNGVLTLNANGSFTYTPSAGFSGTDSFTYQARDAQANASTATATISVSTTDILFSDNFSRGSDPGPVSPWLVQSGNWTVSGGVLKGGTNTQQTYGFVYLTNSWTNYSVQARIQFSANALGGGVGGRGTPGPGKHYAAWVYPENSAAGSNMLKLIKFQSWTTFGYNGVGSVPMQTVNLPGVGTNWHTVKLAFRGNRIAVYFDGTQMMSVTDTEPVPYSSGSISVDRSTYTTPDTMQVDDVIASPLVAEDNYSVNENVQLTVPAPGVLANDSAVTGPSLTAAVVALPTNGVLNLNPNGSFTYLPNTNFFGKDSFTYQATDGQTNLGVATVGITVVAVNQPPYLPVQADRTIAELMSLTVTNIAYDSDLPPETMTYALISPPAGAAIDTNGIITWTPTLGQGRSTNLITATVTDNGSPPLSATNSFNVVVLAVNTAPVLPVQTNRTIPELTTLVVTNTASDADTPPNTLAYALSNPPAGVVIDTNGVITWTPTEAQGPGTYTITTIVTDNGLPPLSATNSFVVIVNEVNSAPVLPVQVSRTVMELSTLVVTNTASDGDLPPNNLFYTLLVAPTGATISPAGVITWTPTEAQGPGTNIITTWVVDDGVPPLSATNSFTVVVNESNSPPVLPSLSNRTIVTEVTLFVTNAATDPDIPSNTLAYNLQTFPAGAVIDTNGVISWSPTPAQNNTTNTFTTIVTDSNPWAVNSQHLTATNSFTVVVARPTILADITDLILEGCSPTNGAVDPGETVTMLFGLKNTGLGNSANLVATLLETNGVASPSGPQNYGILVAGGAPVSMPYTFSATGFCGGSITATLQLSDGALALGTVTFPILLGQNGVIFSQNFDGVTAPALPAGWTTNASGAELAWVTESTVRDTAPNAAFVNDGANIGLSDLVSPAIALPAGPAQLSFRHTFAFECNTTVATNAYDGAVLEIKIGTNAFVDITNSPGAGWVSNGYNRRIDPSYGNPLTNRWAWSGTNAGFVTTIVDLPTAAQGQTIQLRWRAGSDNGTGGGGWHIDTISITGPACCSVDSTPVLPAQSNRTIAELATLTVTNTASDAEGPPLTLTYQLTASPAGASISTNGIITWTPTEAQGPSTNTFTTVVQNNGGPALSATNSFTVVATEVNTAPVLPVLPNLTLNSFAPLVVTNTATDTDIPANALTYQLLSSPSGAVVDAIGVITWTPAPAQAGSTNLFTTMVTDFNPWALVNQHLSATNSFTVVVPATHNGPSLPAQTNRTINELTALIVTNSAIDSDIPAPTLTYTLVNPPAGAVISSNGVISWTPSEAQGPCTNELKTIVSDNGSPILSATNSFTVAVREVNSAPMLPAQANRTITGVASLVVTNTASDTDIPLNHLTYTLLAAPTNTVIDTNGIIRWTISAAQLPGTNAFTTMVTDDGIPPLSATNTFTVAAFAGVHHGPILPVQPSYTITGTNSFLVVNTAFDDDIPAPILTYSLLQAPANAQIDTNGIITWTPTPAQVPSANAFQTVVSDNYNPSISATNLFTVFVQTQPTGDAPVIQSVSLSNSVATIAWSSKSGRTYRLQYKSNLSDSQWIDIPPDLAASGDTASASDSTSGIPQRFYRVVLLP
jgi:hypothetical protein